MRWRRSRPRRPRRSRPRARARSSLDAIALGAVLVEPVRNSGSGGSTRTHGAVARPARRICDARRAPSRRPSTRRPCAAREVALLVGHERALRLGQRVADAVERHAADVDAGARPCTAAARSCRRAGRSRAHSSAARASARLVLVDHDDEVVVAVCPNARSNARRYIWPTSMARCAGASSAPSPRSAAAGAPGPWAAWSTRARGCPRARAAPCRASRRGRPSGCGTRSRRRARRSRHDAHGRLGIACSSLKMCIMSCSHEKTSRQSTSSFCAPGSSAAAACSALCSGSSTTMSGIFSGVAGTESALTAASTCGRRDLSARTSIESVAVSACSNRTYRLWRDGPSSTLPSPAGGGGVALGPPGGGLARSGFAGCPAART